MKESEIQKQIIKYLELKKYCFWRNYVGPILRGPTKRRSPNPMAGLPDIIGVLKSSPRMFVIEVKTKTGKLSEKQVVWLDKLNKAGALCIVARTVAEVIDAFEMHDKV